MPFPDNTPKKDIIHRIKSPLGRKASLLPEPAVLGSTSIIIFLMKTFVKHLAEKFPHKCDFFLLTGALPRIYPHFQPNDGFCL